MQHDHAAAALGLIQVGGAQQHRQALLSHQTRHDFPQLPARQRVDADGGLIEQQQLR